jgi:mannosyl-3-phosphoglycerate phosphatase
MSFIIFTDLDGTLLSYNNYSFHEALDALAYIKEYSIPCIVTTSKTFKETVDILKKLDFKEPFIVENGGGIFFPSIYHNKTINVGESYYNYKCICLGIKRSIILDFAKYLRNIGFNIKLYSEFSVKELSNYTGLTEEETIKSMDRQFSEPFIFLGEDEAKLPLLKEKAQLNEIKILKGGRFYHFVGINQDKGNAIKIMQKHLEELMGDKYISIGIGDSQNDVDMFKVVDIPILVKKFDGSFENININKILRSNLIGPAGFNEMILKILTYNGGYNG